nr:hypothetical protein CFP56_73203 [Quercus suber]
MVKKKNTYDREMSAAQPDRPYPVLELGNITHQIRSVFCSRACSRPVSRVPESHRTTIATTATSTVNIDQASRGMTRTVAKKMARGCASRTGQKTKVQPWPSPSARDHVRSSFA